MVIDFKKKMYCVRRSLEFTPYIKSIATRTASKKSNNGYLNCATRSRTFSTVNETPATSNNVVNNSTETTQQKGGFAKAFEKHSNLSQDDDRQSYTFASLLRNSKIMDLGDPTGKTVIGKIFHVVEDDLYIDFGWKFHCVCTRPTKRSNEYVRGARVRIQINELELSSRFLGSSTDLTLLEADCKLMGIVSSPVRPTVSENKV